ncbi:MAG: aldo/keto reductase [Treponema sp.]|jgi:predicted aldo/keto reductase-like oxidoreductase|nr:aldo/keto reductase [Treponema sp.]
MIYREYGKTGKKASVLGFGGMRFNHIDNHDECIRMMVAAARGGVNYFDTAPGYFELRSETVFGKGFAELRRLGLPYYAATKTFRTAESEVRAEVESQLKRLDIPAIDFYHIWCVNSLDNWQYRKKDGIINTFKKLKNEGLIRHICISSHLIRDEIKELLMEDVFEGVLFGYSAYNYKTREAAFKAIQAKKLGAVVMNPLGGGLIPQNPERFAFLKRPGEEIVPAALRFLWDHEDITVTLVGFGSEDHVKEALSAVDSYKPRSAKELEEFKAGSYPSLEGICTGCAYCDKCPAGVPVSKFMDAYNQKILSNRASSITDRLRWHWNLEAKQAALCNACGRCEKACTQHLNIIKRLKEIAG